MFPLPAQHPTFRQRITDRKTGTYQGGPRFSGIGGNEYRLPFTCRIAAVRAGAASTGRSPAGFRRRNTIVSVGSALRAAGFITRIKQYPRRNRAHTSSRGVPCFYREESIWIAVLRMPWTAEWTSGWWIATTKA